MAAAAAAAAAAVVALPVVAVGGVTQVVGRRQVRRGSARVQGIADHGRRWSRRRRLAASCSAATEDTSNAASDFASQTLAEQAEALSYYKVLGVSPSAGFEEIRSSYRSLSKLYHPDSTTLPAEEAAKRWSAVQEAYTTLNTPEKKRLYDWALASSRNGGQYVWPYEAMSAKSSQPQRQDEMGLSAVDRLPVGENLPLSGQAGTALLFDLFAIVVAVAVITAQSLTSDSMFGSIASIWDQFAAP